MATRRARLPESQDISPSRGPKWASTCASPDAIFRNGIRINTISKAVLAEYNKLMGTDLQLYELEVAYHKPDAKFHEARRALIHQHIWQLLRFAQNNVDVPKTNEPDVDSRARRKLIKILRGIHDEIYANTVDVHNLDEVLAKIHTMEERSREAHAIADILGSWAALGCDRRIREQLLHIQPGKDSRHTQPKFLLRGVWPAFEAEMHELHRELTDRKTAGRIRDAYQHIFPPDTGLSFNLRHTLSTYDRSEDPREWVQALYRELGTFLYVNLFDNRDLKEDVTSNEGTFLSMMHDHSPNQFHPCAGRMHALPVGVGLELSQQLRIAKQFGNVTGYKHVNLGKLAILGLVQQANVNGAQLCDRHQLTVSSCHGRKARPIQPDDPNPDSFLNIYYVRPNEVGIDDQFTRLPRPRRGFAFEPAPRYMQGIQ